MRKAYFCLLLVISARAKPQNTSSRQRAVWADEIENESEKVITSGPALWADEMGEVELNGPIEHKLFKASFASYFVLNAVFSTWGIDPKGLRVIS